MNTPIYLDVRTPEEFAAGHYPDAINYDVNLLVGGNVPDLAKDAEIKTYCRSGARAGVAKNILEQAGFTNVENVGGLTDILK
jgi:phage shock protein E